MGNDDPFDSERYDFFWQDPNYKPNVINRNEAAEIFGVDPLTIDRWVRRGAPVLKRPGQGKPVEISSAHFWEWRLARAAGLTVEEYRREQLAELAERERERI